MHTYTSLEKIQNGRQYVDVLGFPHSESDIIVAHAGYNFSTQKSGSIVENTAYLNTLSSLSGFIRGHVASTLIGDLGTYMPTLQRYSKSELETIEKGYGALMIDHIIHDGIPEHITYLRIVIAEQASQVLEKYYMSIGIKLKEQGKIKEASYYGGHGYIDGVCFQLKR